MNTIVRSGMIFSVPPPPPVCSHLGAARVLPWRYEDNGVSDRGACAARAIANGTGISYAAALAELELAHSKLHDTPPIAGRWHLDVIGCVLRAMGWRYTAATRHLHLHDLADNTTTLIVALVEHMTAIAPGGVVVDRLNASDHAFNVESCVRGWFQKENV
jgi:hypothetical protein